MRTDRHTTTLLGALLAVGLLSLLLAPASAQANGFLTQKAGTAGCVLYDVSNPEGCATSNSIYGASDLIASPDGNNVYVLSSDGGLTIFNRAADGSLTQSGCVFDYGGGPAECSDAYVLYGASAIAISPDGKNVYVAAGNDDGIEVLNRNTTTGALSENSCLSADGKDGNNQSIVCTVTHDTVNPRGITVSPDGSQVYVVSQVSAALTVFNRNSSTGALTQQSGAGSCVSESGSGGACANGAYLTDPSSVVVSPDGDNVYVTSGGNAGRGTVNSFDRAAGGGVTQKAGTAGCFSENDAGGGCVDGRGLFYFTSAVVVSPDGNQLYTAAGSAIAVIDRAGDGTLSQPADTTACISDDGWSSGNGQCADGNKQTYHYRLAISPDGKSVYAPASFYDNALDVFDRAANGNLTQKPGSYGCVSDSGTDGCANGRQMEGIYAVTVSPDNKSVYTADNFGCCFGAVDVFDRDVADPIAVGDTKTVSEDDAATTVDVLANDTDSDGGPKYVSAVTQPANGSVQVTNAGADLTYQPNPNYCNNPPGGSPDTVTYTLNGVSTVTASVAVTVDCVDDVPVAVADSAAVTEDASATAISVLANDTDIDGGTKVIASVTQPANGTAVATGGSPGAHTGLTYQPNPNYCNNPPGSSKDSFSYTLNGGSTGTVQMTVNCVDDLPVAVADPAAVTEDASATAISVLANDTDIDGGTKVIASVTQPANGTAVATGGSPGAHTGLTYQPNPDYCNNPPGSSKDSFTYTLNGGSSATVSMTVNCVDDYGAAVADTATLSEDDPATTIDVLANETDVDGGPGPEIEGLNSTPAHGTVEIAPDNLSLTYQPDPDYCNDGSPTDDFDYQLVGGSIATVAVTVDCTDDTSLAVDDAATVTEDDPASTIEVRANDTDIDVGPEQVASVTQPSHGVAAVTNGGDDLSYQPDPDYCNDGSPADDFSYQLDGGASAAVAVTVDCVNDAPSSDAGGPYAISEGGSLDLDGSGDDVETAAGDLYYDWDVNGDDSFGDFSGQSPHIGHAELETLGLGDGPESVTVKLLVSDGTTDQTESAGVALDVTNVAPALLITGPATPIAGQASDWTFAASDPSNADQAAQFTYRIDWNGDGSTDETVSGAATQTVSHSFSAFGPVTVRATATDKDGGESGVASSASQVSPAPVVPGPELDACARSHGQKQILGTVSFDLLAGTPKADRILGGRGDDRLMGLAGADCLVGGRGDDKLVGGHDFDALLGRSGRDQIDASSPEADLVECGRGRDRAQVSANDVVKRCELVKTFG